MITAIRKNHEIIQTEKNSTYRLFSSRRVQYSTLLVLHLKLRKNICFEIFAGQEGTSICQAKSGMEYEAFCLDIYTAIWWRTDKPDRYICIIMYILFVSYSSVAKVTLHLLVSHLDLHERQKIILSFSTDNTDFPSQY